MNQVFLMCLLFSSPIFASEKIVGQYHEDSYSEPSGDDPKHQPMILNLEKKKFSVNGNSGTWSKKGDTVTLKSSHGSCIYKFSDKTETDMDANQPGLKLLKKKGKGVDFCRQVFLKKK